ncbi:hypothetical protein M493_05410 [Geobacillus genomosp. 3]|uniref:Uncharacterized protein n=1 Tax=Geobacillus genomosp. 3 TaxID=1921421 RepID=S6A0X2_GEOG3|nr:hypothetical protein M493_05410 [Geobacillus genomosp. 3]
MHYSIYFFVCKEEMNVTRKKENRDGNKKYKEGENKKGGIT